MSALDHVRDLGAFVTASPSSYHAAREVASRLDRAGYREQLETSPWDPSPGGHYLVRDGAVVAWRIPTRITAESGFRIVGAHTDSPGFKLKPQPASTAAGWAQAGMEVYGGPLVNSWLDREFGLAGRVVTLSGEVRLVRTGPWLRIPQVAPHLDRGAHEQLRLDRQHHLKPVFGLAESAPDLMTAIADLAGIDAEDVVGHDLFAYVTEPPGVIGLDADLFASPRLDNLSSVHAGMVALLDADQSVGLPVLACFDHEEIGSGSRSGAQGPVLEQVLTRISLAAGISGDSHHRMLAASSAISADAGHAIHPNYPHLHDPDHRPLVNRGPLLKVNANQRYTSEGPSAALWFRACAEAGVPTQAFVSNNAVPCGSTIGPLTATRLGIMSVDVGIPLLSMHSARELAGVHDPLWLAEALRAYFAGV